MPGDGPDPGTLAIDGDPVARPPSVRPVADRAEALFMELRLLGEAPVVDEQHLVAVDERRLRLVDDERPVEPAAICSHARSCGWYQKVPASGATKS